MPGKKRSLWESACNTPECNGLLNEAIYADHEGRRIHFCTFKCRNEFLLNPQEVIKRICNAGITLPQAAASSAAPAKR